MRALGVVVLAPPLDDDPRFSQAVEDLAVEQLISQLRVEALAIAIFPWTAGLDVGRPGSDSGDPFPDRSGQELRGQSTDMRGDKTRSFASRRVLT